MMYEEAGLHGLWTKLHGLWTNLLGCISYSIINLLIHELSILFI